MLLLAFLFIYNQRTFIFRESYNYLDFTVSIMIIIFFVFIDAFAFIDAFVFIEAFAFINIPLKVPVFNLFIFIWH